MDALAGGLRLAPSDTALGVPFMDFEHEFLFGMYDELRRTLEFRPRTKFFAERFSSVTPYMADHFGHEEFVMRRLNYARYFEHRMQHEGILRDAEDFLWGIRKYYNPDECYALARLLSLWLKHHVDEHDRLLADFIRGQTEDDSTLRHLPIFPQCGIALASTPSGSDMQQARSKIRSRMIRSVRSSSFGRLWRSLGASPLFPAMRQTLR